MRLIFDGAWAFALGLPFFFFTVSAFAIGDRPEAHLAYASSALRAGDFAAALAEVDDVLQKRPEDPNALELKALTLTGSGQTDEALKIYQRLFKNNEPHRGAYAFEMGLIELERGHLKEARSQFSTARNLNFNRGAAAFFQALANFRGGESDAADKLFAGVSNSTDPADLALKAPARYYQAKIATERGQSKRATALLANASVFAEAQVKDANPEAAKLGSQIKASVDAALFRTASRTWLVGLQTLTEYDSNAILLSDETASGEKPSTLKQTLLAGVGGSGPTSGAGSWALTARTLINYNFSQQAKSAEYAANEVEGSYLFGFRRWKVGPLVRGLALFRNQGVESAGESYRPYVYSGSGGVAAEAAFASGVFRLEAGAGAASFLNDSDLDPALRRSGFVAEATLAYLMSPTGGLFSPGARLELARQNTSGAEFRATHARAVLINHLVLRKWQSEMEASIGQSSYGERANEARSDFRYGVDLLVSRDLTMRLSLLLRAGWLVNNSNISAQFSYNRATGGLGLRYAF